MSNSASTYHSLIDNLKPAVRKEALRKVIEMGGLNRDVMVELRRQYLELTERDGMPAKPAELTGEEAR